MRWTPRMVRAGVVVALVLPALIVLMAGSLQAQFPKQGPKFPQPPPLPKFETVWVCPNFKCKKEIGKPPAPPPATCPFCGTKILNGVGPANPPPSTPPPNNPAPKQPVGPVPGQQNLAGTTWSGTETLAGYGNLTFQFQPGGQVSMLDRDGNTAGTWNTAGNSINISFPNLGIFYTGTINGNQMNGTAQNGKDNWSWTLRNNQANPPPVNVPPPVANVPPPVVNPPPPADNNPDPIVNRPDARASSRMSGGAIAAIIIGGVLFFLVVLAAAGVGIFFIVKSPDKKPRPRRKKPRPPRNDDE